MPISSIEAVEIRTATEADRAGVREVTLAAYDEYRALMPPEAWAAYSANIATTIDAVDIGYCVVAVAAGMIVGSVLLFPADFRAYGRESTETPSYPEVRLLAVPPSERGRGVGQALMDECKRRALSAGATYLGLHTNAAMKAALRMYERMGFERTPETDFRPEADLLVMGFRLALSPSATPRA